MRTGDVVFHRPSGETWVVAYADEERGELVPCGWPFTIAQISISDCDLREATNDAEHLALLKRLAGMQTHDPRKWWAERELERRHREPVSDPDAGAEQ